MRFSRIHKRWFYALPAAAAAADIVLPRLFPGGEGHFGFEDIPGWDALYGFGSCVAIIVVSKLLGKLWLMRREDYYDE